MAPAWIKVGLAAAAGSGYYVGDLKVGDTAINISDVQTRLEFNVGFLF